MTAKEKADELLKKFFAVDFEDGEAQRLARIVCDEVIEELKQKEQNTGIKFSLIWWNDVKKWVNANS